MSMLAAISLLASTTVPCDLAQITSARAIHETLSRRAVRIVTLATETTPQTDAQLSALVNEAAEFNLGASDVGRPLGTGFDGARRLAREMGADQFRFLSWNYMDSPADGCGRQEVTVEFIDTRQQRVSQVEFTFELGRLITARGRQRSFEAGAIRPLASNNMLAPINIHYSVID
jgi:hypothetical protein